MLIRTVKLLLLILLATLPLGQFSRLPLPMNDLAVYLNDLILPALILLWLTQKMIIERSLKLPAPAGWIFLFAAIAFLSLLNGLRYVSLGEWLISGLYLARWVQYAFLYFIARDLTRRREFPKLRFQIVTVLFFAFSVFALAGLVQFTFFPDFSKYVQHGWDPHYYRVLSTFFDPNFAGFFLSFAFFLGVGFLVTGTLSRKQRAALAGYLGLLLTTIILTFSRSTYLAFLVGTGVAGLVKSRWLLLVIGLVVILAFLFIPRVQTRVIGAANLDKTAQFRIASWKKTLTIIGDHPFLGVGFNTFRYAQEDYGYFRDKRGINQPSGHAGAGADSSLLFLWATAGIGGLLAYLGMLGAVWLRAGKQLLQGKGVSKVIGLALLAGLPAWLVHAQFVNSLFYPWIMETFWVLTALL